MTAFLPTTEALRTIAEALGRAPNDQTVATVFDHLILSGHLLPWLPDWWELHRLDEKAIRRVALRHGLHS